MEALIAGQHAVVILYVMLFSLLIWAGGLVLALPRQTLAAS